MKFYKILRFLLWVACISLLAANISPYVQIARLIFADAGGNLLCSQLGVMPVIGGMLRWACSGGARIIWGISGLLLWAIFQLVEIIPLLDYFDKFYILGFIRRKKEQTNLQIEDGDDDSLKKAKKRHNRVTDLSRVVLLVVAILFYLIDTWMMFFWLYPPINRLGGLDPSSLVRSFLSVFGVELVLLLIILLNNVIDPTSVQNPLGRSKPAKEY